MRFLAEAAVLVGEVRVLLEFGCGPTVHHLLPFANVARTIHVADYLRANLVAVRRWVDEDDEAWDWSAFAEAALSNELGVPRIAGRSPIVWRSCVDRSPSSTTATRAASRR